ncbi:MAG: crotonase/enoyl-CoA hydratase family protein [Nitratireductor sp.]
MGSQSPMLLVDVDGPIATLTMNRPDKRNAMCDGLLEEIEAFFTRPPEGVKVAILTGTAGHYCSGLDLSEHVARDAEGTMRHSRGWHRVMETIQYGGLPVVSAMFGAVIGGGLELAASTHVRIAEPSTIFQLPEGRRGIFVGGGATVRVGRILGADRMIEMMLTGRKYNGEEGVALGLAHYLAAEGGALALARGLGEDRQ